MRTLQKQSERNKLPLLQRGKCNTFRHSGFMGNCLTVSHTCLLYLPRRLAFPSAPGVAERNEHSGGI